MMEGLKKKIRSALQGIRFWEFALWMLVAVLFFVLDITLKYHYYYRYTENPKLMGEAFLPGVINTTLVFNDGAAWNIGSGMKPLLSMISLIMALVIFGALLFGFKKLPIFAKLGLALCLSGDVGNLVDRLGFWAGVGIYKDHGVIDFIQLAFVDFPIFNIADSCLVVGILILMVGYIVELILSSARAKKIQEENPELNDQKALMDLVMKHEAGQENPETDAEKTEEPEKTEDKEGKDNGTDQ